MRRAMKLRTAEPRNAISINMPKTFRAGVELAGHQRL